MPSEVLHRSPPGWIPLAGLLSFLSCSRDVGVVCTDIGCSSGVEIVLDRSAATAFKVEAFPPGSSALYVYNCPDPGQCGTRIFFQDFTPDYVNVRVIVGTDTSFAEAVRPQYTEFRPNGVQCPPICRVGQVPVVLPP